MMNAGKKDENSVWFSWIGRVNSDPNAQRITDRFVKRPAVAFYDTQNDPQEFKNLVTKPAYQKRISFYKPALQKGM